VENEIAKKTTSLDSDNVRQWHQVAGDQASGQYYYGFFSSDMPDFNFDNPEVRKEFYDIGRFWLSEVGVDGFRMDAAKHLFPDHRLADSQAFWKEFRAEMQQARPDVYLIGEVWSDAESASPFAAGFTSLFNFDLAYSILESVKMEQSAAAKVVENTYQMTPDVHLADLFNESLPLFRQQNKAFIEATFLSNHDQMRVGSMLEGDIDKMKLAACILFTLPGTPYLYYGEEIGMYGKKPDEYIREPMLWHAEAEDVLRTSWIAARYSTDKTVAPVAAQVNDSQSIYHLYKRLIALKKTSLFAEGEIIKIASGNPAALAFERKLGKASAAVYHNLSSDRVEIKLSNHHQGVLFAHGETGLHPTKLTLGAYASLAIRSTPN